MLAVLLSLTLTPQTTDDPLAILSSMPIEEVLAIGGIRPVRLHEVQCIGTARWMRANNSGAPPPAAHIDTAAAEITRRTSAETGVRNIAIRAMFAAYGGEIDARIATPGADRDAVIAEHVSPCTSLFAAITQGDAAILAALAPARDPAVVDPQLAACAAAYGIAAREATGDEAAALAGDADRARALALDGKLGDARTRAERALAEAEAEDAAQQSVDAETRMARLVQCQIVINRSARK